MFLLKRQIPLLSQYKGIRHFQISAIIPLYKLTSLNIYIYIGRGESISFHSLTYVKTIGGNKASILIKTHSCSSHIKNKTEFYYDCIRLPHE